MVHQDRAVAVIPIQSHKSGFTDLEFCRTCREFFVRSVFGFHITDEPFEDVADRRLACFESEIAGQNAAVDDAA